MFPCLHIIPGKKGQHQDVVLFTSVCVLWELLLNLYFWVETYCSSTALLVRFGGSITSPNSTPLAPSVSNKDPMNQPSVVDVVHQQLEELIYRLYGVNPGDRGLIHVEKFHQNILHQLTLVMVDKGDSFDIWFTGFGKNDPRVDALTSHQWVINIKNIAYPISIESFPSIR